MAGIVPDTGELDKVRPPGVVNGGQRPESVLNFI